MNLPSLTLAACILLVSCAKKENSNAPQPVDVNVPKTEILTLRVAPYKSPCEAGQITWCLTLVNAEGATALYYYGIEGFQHKPGYSYELSILRTERESILPDSPPYWDQLKEILSETEDRRPFSFAVNPKWFTLTDASISLIGEPIIIEDADLLQDLKAWQDEVTSDLGYMGDASFLWTADGSMKLVEIKKKNKK